MTYHQFVMAVEEKLKEVVDKDITLSIYEADKNNGVKRIGITFSKQGINLSPTIYLEEYYDKYQEGFTFEGIIGDILCLYHEVQVRKVWDEELLTEFEAVKERIIYRLINAEANKMLLKDVPNIPYLDLAIVFYVMLEINDQGTACMLIRKEHMEMWDVTMHMLWESAKENTWQILPSEFHTMRAVMKELCHEKEFMGMDILHVLTNQIRNFGATVILYEGCLEMIADFLDDNYYVLPSSVHEVIIMSERDAPEGKKGLSDMVREINHTQVDAEDILSDNAYYYDRETKKLV